MNLDDYQVEAGRTDIVPNSDPNSVIVPMLGLAGEVGTLLSEYKKHLRDGDAYELYQEQVAEDLGDLLWYISSVARKFGLRLSDVAKANLQKIASRWPKDGGSYKLFDEAFPEGEQLPRYFKAEFAEKDDPNGVRVVVTVNGNQIGDSLSDNAHDDDGYRFHDVFHLSYAAVLGWSPISRTNMKCKRRSDFGTNEVEDGARAKLIEELVSQLVFTYARSHNFLEGIHRLDFHLLKTIRTLTGDREVKSRTLAEWEMAIFQGYDAWRQIKRDRGGVVEVDLNNRKICWCANR